MTTDPRRQGPPTDVQNNLGRVVYEQAATGAYVPAWSRLGQAKRWRWIWAGEAAIALGRVETSQLVAAPSPPLRVIRPEGQPSLQINKGWGPAIRQRRKEAAV